MDRKHFIKKSHLDELLVWDKIRKSRKIVSFDLEITARCNNNCRHCYINLPASDRSAKSKELSPEEIIEIAKEAASLGAIWCLLTGGEPLLREDFFEIYVSLKKVGLLVSIFTNATLITKKHIQLFKKYPPRIIEVSVYGITRKTYEKVTRRPGSFNAFIRGLNLLIEGNIKVRLKAMALRSNLHEHNLIATFCKKYTNDVYRFDPFLHLRFDRDRKRNNEIKAERLSAEEIIKIECSDTERFRALKREYSSLVIPAFENYKCNHLFHCGIGNSNFCVGYDGTFRLCNSLWHPDCVYDLKRGSLKDAWENFVPLIQDMRSNSEEFLNKCSTCSIINLCLWCPAHAYLETGKLDRWVEYFCRVAHARADMLKSTTY